MKLQIALDTLNIDECILLLDKIKEYVDIIEVGTPFLLESGFKTIKVLKERYRELEILADTKIMDAGALESEGAFKAGADIVTVLGVTNNETIAGALSSAKKYNGKVMIDMMCVPDLAKRTKELDDFGVNYICCHTAFDVSSTGKTPLNELIVINENIINAESAVAGGVKLETIDEIVLEGAGVVIIGGAITNAKDPLNTIKAIKERMERCDK